MDVKEAVQIATRHLIDLFDSEDISNVGLEEVEFDEQDDLWVVTIGFSRPWDYPGKPLNAFATALGATEQPKRTYKTIRVKSGKGDVISVRNRATPQAS